MKSNNIIIGVVVLLLIIGGGYWLVKGQMVTRQSLNSANSNPQAQGNQQVNPTSTTNAQNLSNEPNKSSVTVEYTEQGFNPKSITVKLGTTVTWVNKCSEGANDMLWVASDPHPTHQDYPGFDALKSIPTGGTYSFTFTKIGRWGYHNHLEPGRKGEVVIEQ